MGKKVQKCSVCKRNPVWQGGDVKNPGPVCKRCYHKGAGFTGGGTRHADKVPDFPSLDLDDYSWTDIKYSIEQVEAEI